MNIYIILSILIFIFFILLAFYLYSKRNPSPNPPNPNPTPNETLEYSLQSGYLGDYYVDLPLENKTYTVLADTGSTPFIINKSEYDSENKKPADGPMATLQYLGISAKPDGWYIDQLKGTNWEFPVGEVTSDNNNFPNILGLADMYSPPEGGHYFGFTDWNNINNIAFDFSRDKFIINDTSKYSISIPRNMDFIKLFKTSFYCGDMDVSLADKKYGKIPVIIDTGMSITVHYSLKGVADSPDDLDISFNGRKLFSIGDGDRMELPEESVDSKWKGKPYIILSNKALIEQGYKISFTKDTIFLEKQSNAKFVPVETTAIVKNIFKNNPQILANRYS